MTKKVLFTSDMYLGDIINMHKDSLRVLKSFGLNCNTCSGKDQDSLKTGAINNGLDPNEILKALNELK